MMGRFLYPRAMSRRDFLRFVGVGTLSYSLSACGIVEDDEPVTGESGDTAPATRSVTPAEPEPDEGEGASLTATFFDVGKADAMVLQSGNACLMVDTGAADTGKELVEALGALGISGIDALVITHFDQDHVGGAADVLNNLSVGSVYVTYQSKESDEVDAYEAAMAAQGLAATELAVGSTLDLTLGAMKVHLIAPEKTDYGEDDTSNDSSLIARVTCGNVAFLLAGDVERGRMEELLASGETLTCDVLKMPHHGAYEKNLDDFVEACAPGYAIITSSKDEKEDDKTIDLLEDAKVEYYLTRKGTVTITTDGSAIEVTQD